MTQTDTSLGFIDILDMMGAPVFTLDREPPGAAHDKLIKGLYRAPAGWSHFTAEGNERRLSAAKPGCAYGMVCGYAYDVIDIDPRNGGDDSLITMATFDWIPEVRWVVKTPGGGWHFYIDPLSVGKRQGLMPGVDLQGASSFVFLPPTEGYHVISK